MIKKGNILGIFTYILILGTAGVEARQLGGIIYNDANYNGVMDPGEGAISGLQIQVALDNGSTLTTSSSETGQWAMTIPDTASARVSFGAAANGMTPSIVGPDGSSCVLFLEADSAPAVDLDYGLADPADFCPEEPDILIACYVSGTSSNQPADTLVKFNYTDRTNDPHTAVSTAEEIGSVFGLAYQSAYDIMYSASFMKRHAGFGPGGPGALYLVEQGASAVTNTIDLYALFPDTAVPDPHPSTTAFNPDWFYDVDSWDAVGKMGLGDVEVSPDDSTVFVMNLSDKRLYVIDVTDPYKTFTTDDIDRYNLPVPDNCPNPALDFRPFATEYHEGTLYVGAICSAESTQNRADMHLYVYQFDPETRSFDPTPVLSFPLAYPRGVAYTPPVGTPIPADWNPWTNQFTTLVATFNQNFQTANVGYPQAMFVDMEILCNGDMVLGLRDRASDQFGDNMGSTNPPDAVRYRGYGAGDVLRASPNGAGGWLIENNSMVGLEGPTAGINTGEGPGGGEFYFDDSFYDPVFQETGLGGLLYLPCDEKILNAHTDPIETGNIDVDSDQAGVKWLANSNGASCGELLIYDADSNADGTGGGTFGKVNGLGDLEALCPPAPIEVGNRVWMDDNRDGIQDPGEAGIPGVLVELRDANHRIVASQMTDADGEYLFTLQDRLTYFTDYFICVRLDQAPIGILQLSPANTTDDLIDSDASITNVSGVNYAKIPFTTGGPGAMDCSLDLGFFPPPMDHGDLPAAYAKTLNAEDGPRHIIVPGVFLGAAIDSEDDGVPHPTANGDGPDDDGILVLDPLKPGASVRIQVTASVAGLLNGWVDWEGNNLIDDQVDNRVATDLVVPAGVSTFSVNVPLDAVLDTPMGARFRFNTRQHAVAATPCGLAPDGEVEDYVLQVEAEPGIVLEKTVYLGHSGGSGCATAGESVTAAENSDITYCFRVINTGDCHLAAITVDDVTLGISRAQLSLLSGTEPLAPGASLVFYVDRQLTEPLVNTATTCGNPVDSAGRDISTLPLVKSADTARVDTGAPSMRLEKTVYKGHNSGINCPTAGEFVGDVTHTEITYCFKITNLGDTWLGALELDDLDLGISEADVNLLPDSGSLPLAPGSNITYFIQTRLMVDLTNTVCVQMDATEPAGTPLPGFDTLEECDTAVVAVEEVSLGDFVWFDNDANGQQNGEPGVPGATVWLADCDGNRIRSDQTDANGFYEFSGLPLGSYRVELDLTTLPANYRLTDRDQGSDQTDSDADSMGVSPCVALHTDGVHDPTLDFGIISSVAVGDRAWLDLDYDGIQDPGEPPVPGVTVQLKGEGPAVLDTTVTDENGNYLFDELTPGRYRVCFQPPAGCQITRQNQGADITRNSKADPDTGETPLTAVLSGGQADLNLDIGLWKPACIGDTVWADLNVDRVVFPDTRIDTLGLPGVTVSLYSMDNGGGMTLIETQKTVATVENAGYYKFGDLPPGQYCVKIDAGVNDPAIPEDLVIATTPLEYCLTLTSGQFYALADFGFTPEPTAVDLIGFAAAVVEGGVLLQWQTGSEREALGFHVIREGADGAVTLNPQLIRANNRASGSAYEFIDAQAGCGDYTYSLMSVDLNLNQEVSVGAEIRITCGGVLTAAGLQVIEGNAGQSVLADGIEIPSHPVEGGLLIYLEDAAELTTIDSDKPLRMAMVTADEGEEVLVVEGGAPLLDITDPANPAVLIGEALEAGAGTAAYYRYATGTELILGE